MVRARPRRATVRLGPGSLRPQGPTIRPASGRVGGPPGGPRHSARRQRRLLDLAWLPLRGYEVMRPKRVPTRKNRPEQAVRSPQKRQKLGKTPERTKETAQRGGRPEQTKPSRTGRQEPRPGTKPQSRPGVAHFGRKSSFWPQSCCSGPFDIPDRRIELGQNTKSISIEKGTYEMETLSDHFFGHCGPGIRHSGPAIPITSCRISDTSARTSECPVEYVLGVGLAHRTGHNGIRIP